MTNGEKIKEIFPYLESDDTDLVWWNAEYKEPTTKNDLGVDCISRQAVLDLINADWKYENLEMEINNLPSVTPQESRKGHWIDTNYHQYYNDGDIETTELRCSCCNEEVEWDIVLSHKPYYCENCGACMIGEVEG